MIDLHQQDCLEGMRSMPDGCVDVVVTSPPYNIGIDYGTYDDRRDRKDFLAWCREWATEVRRVMSENGSLFLNVGAVPKNPLLPHQLLLALVGEEPLFHLQNTFHWIKSISVETRAGETHSVGHFKPVHSRRFVNDCHEYVFHLTKTGNVPLDRRAAGVEYADKQNVNRWKTTEGIDKRCRGNTWFIPYDTIKSRDKERPHPAAFPIGLVKQCVTLHGLDETAHLMDPFLGIGTSALAARDLGIDSFTGFEIDESYLTIARERLADVPLLK
ncbi:site-specific DNA-methyltransferase [Akkermansiaceae bacterium]|nr:site-specific DNA-methyltransferase [Akkermansiaceae bacterium]MDB4319071.1 site-specific DNA-methyltransferase [bacterium]MDA7518672.1 site-specific DNA-methyltransferase [Akkermansiaceae bacterium]MDA7863297.1 site-specific DNA-methyltransferase [Akkermansiaceae bacterium]MDA8876019.1 site-specific DNA-methyltransferase [Akkermansiaceae bacterium]